MSSWPIIELSNNFKTHTVTFTMDPKYTDAFQQLDLNKADASWEEVRTSYKKKVQKLHPDRVQQGNQTAANQEKFIRVTRAYKLLNEYHRKNDDLPRDYVQQADPAMQVDLGSFNNINDVKLASVIESIQYNQKPSLGVLKVVVISCALAVFCAVGLLSYASWQKSQIPPITPFTSDKPMPLSSDRLVSEK